MTDFPDYNNVYGHVVTPDGLAPVLDAVGGVEGVSKASIYVSGYNGAESLILSSDLIDFRSEPLDSGQHLLNGGVAGTIDEVIVFVAKLSHALSGAGVEHNFEVYNEEQELIKEIPGSG